MLAEELITLSHSRRETPPFTDTYPSLTPAQGYEAAGELHRHRVARGWKPLGRKIGFTNRTIWPRYGVYEPIWGTVYDRTVTRAVADRAVVALDGLVNPRIEPEICFALKSAPRGTGLGALLEAIDWVAHSIEIVQSRFPGWKFQLADALPSLEIELLKEGAQVDRGVGANVLDSPLLALGHLVGVLAGQPGAAPLSAGEIISTGTITDAHPVRPGETWSTRLRGLPLPGLTVRFT